MNANIPNAANTPWECAQCGRPAVYFRFANPSRRGIDTRIWYCRVACEAAYGCQQAQTGVGDH